MRKRQKLGSNLIIIYYTSSIFGSFPLRVCFGDNFQNYIKNQQEEESISKCKRRFDILAFLCGVICSIFWLVAIITIDIHPFRFRIETVRQRNSSSFPLSTVTFPLLMEENIFSKMAIVSIISKTLKTFILVAQILRIPRVAIIIEQIHNIDSFSQQKSLLDEQAYTKMRKCECVYVLTTVCSSLMLLSFTFLYNEYGSHENLINKTLILIDDFTLMTIFTIEIQLYSFCKMLEQRLIAFNLKLKISIESIDKCYDQRKGLNQSHANTSTTSDKEVESILFIFWKLVDLFDTIIKTYRLQIFFGLCLTYLHVLIDAYLTMFSINESQNTTWAQVVTVKPLHHIFRLSLISRAGYIIKRQVPNNY